MSIVLPAGLPARRALLAEGIEVLSREQLGGSGLRALRLCLVNLMPSKAVTETQIARLVGATSIPVELVLCLPDGYQSRSTPADHLALYQPWSKIRDEEFHALIVTGAPIETLPFEEVTYWSDLCAIFDWARSRGMSSLYLCWAAQAALHHFHGIPKHSLPEKKFGVFRQRITSPGAGLLRGFGEEFPVPVSRHTEVRAADLPAEAGLTVLAASQDAGLCLVGDRRNRAVHMFNHLEYDAETLREEYLRDRSAGKPVDMPRNYFPGDDPQRMPANVWQPFAHLLFANWLGEIYRRAWPHLADEPVIEWALTAARTTGTGGVESSDLLISAASSEDILPAVLRGLADAGIAPQALKVHWRPDARQYIELRLGRLHDGGAERIARRLSGLRAVSKVAFRTNGILGGWLLGHPHAAEPDEQASGRLSRETSAPPEAA